MKPDCPDPLRYLGASRSQQRGTLQGNEHTEYELIKVVARLGEFREEFAGCGKYRRSVVRFVLIHCGGKVGVGARCNQQLGARVLLRRLKDVPQELDHAVSRQLWRKTDFFSVQGSGQDFEQPR